MLRDLSIRVFHIKQVLFADKTSILDDVLNIEDISKNEAILKDKRFSPHIKQFTVSIIPPMKRDIQINTVIDFVPISVKALGKIGEGITYTLHGVKLMLTGCDVDGRQAAEFGSSEGILGEQVKFNKAGTPSDDEYIIHVDILFSKNAISSREIVNAGHILSEVLVQSIREQLKKLDGTKCSERHDYSAKRDKGSSAKKVLIIKQVAGQGAMYDTRLFGYEPSGFEGGYSIIDMNSMPVMITPNEYRDGAIRALY